jgi:hypothetical protein
MTRSSRDGAAHSFATLRVAGDALVPEEVTRILRLRPMLAYAKGEKYSPGPKAGELTGRTGVWYFSTEHVVESPSPNDHLLFLVAALAPDTSLVGALLPAGRNVPASLSRFLKRIFALKLLMRKKGLETVITLFWHGTKEARPPPVPLQIEAVLSFFSIRLERDFAAEEEPELVRVGG